MMLCGIRCGDAVRYMSVRAGLFAPGRTDSHGHCPRNALTCPNLQAAPFLRNGCMQALEEARGLAWLGSSRKPGTAEQPDHEQMDEANDCRG